MINGSNFTSQPILPAFSRFAVLNEKTIFDPALTQVEGGAPVKAEMIGDLFCGDEIVGFKKHDNLPLTGVQLS